MEVDKVLKFATDAFAEYFQALVGTLTHAHVAFPPLYSRIAERTVGPEIVAVATEESVISERIDPRLFGYVVISVLFAAAANSIMGSSFEATFVLVTTLFLLLSWLLYSSIVFLVCRLLGGRGTYLATISATMQLLATVLVVSIFIGIGVVAVAIVGGDPTPHEGLPPAVYYAVHVPLLSIYIPLMLRRIHRLSWPRLILLSVLPPILGAFGLLVTVFVLTGGRFGS
jgi:hypothetical protein